MNPAQRARRRALTRSALLAVGLALIGIAIGQTRPWRGLEERAQGLIVSSRPPRAWNPQVLVIEVDDQSLKELSWPVRRDVYAQLVQAAAGAGARVAAFDIYFTAPSNEPNDDLALGLAAADWGQVVLPVECIQDGEQASSECSDFNLPAGKMADGVTLAHVNALDSPSGYYRGEYWWIGSRGRRLPALALAAFARGNHLEIKQDADVISVGAHEFPSGSEGAAIVSYRDFPLAGRRSLRWVLAEMKTAPVGAVPESLLSLFKDKYLVIGQTAPAIGDHGPVITGRRMPLVAVHAALLSDLIEGRLMREASAEFSALLVLLGTLLLMTTALLLRPSFAIALGVVLVGGFIGGCVWAAGEGWLISPLAPLLSGIFAFAATLATRLAVQERERQVLRSAFGAYVAPAVLERVLEDPDRYLALGGAKKTLSVLFSDIKGYTGLTNELPADQVMQLLREYLEAMTRVVKKHEGRVDKIMGDGILAVFGDPIPHDDHAQRAVTVGMQMLEEVARLQHLWTSQGKKGIAIRIGIATGEVFVGNIGSADTKIEYTVLGPTVNLASRLEGKAPAGAMLVSEETYQACRGRYSFHAIGGLELKGFTDTYKAWLFVGAGLEGDPERVAPRLPTLAPVLVSLGGITVQGMVENVSAGGLYVIAEGKVAPGDVVELEFPISSHLAAPVTVRAEVRHVARREDGLQGLGVRIERADAQRGDDLRHFVALYLGPQPDGGRVDSGGDTFRLELGEAYGRLIKEKPS